MATKPVMNTMAIADSESQGRVARKRMWPSFETATRLQDIANFFLIGALVVGVVATALVVWMGNVKEEYLRRDLAETNARAEEAKADASQSLAAAKQAESNLAGANSRAEEARAASAEANARAAEANKIAEGERLARVKIEERLAPRSITPTQISGLAKRLKPYAGMSIDILQIGESPEITHFRSLIETPLRDAGLHVLSSTAVGSGSFVGLSVGVFIDAKEPEKAAASALLSALNAEGINAANDGAFKRENWPGFTMAPPDSNKAAIRIYIGSKP